MMLQLDGTCMDHITIPLVLIGLHFADINFEEYIVAGDTRTELVYLCVIVLSIGYLFIFAQQ